MEREGATQASRRQFVFSVVQCGLLFLFLATLLFITFYDCHGHGNRFIATTGIKENQGNAGTTVARTIGVPKGCRQFLA
ncbi:hypothetical protein [Noviherbaspirillum agri]